jgi:hypothetical protein
MKLISWMGAPFRRFFSGEGALPPAESAVPINLVLLDATRRVLVETREMRMRPEGGVPLNLAQDGPAVGCVRQVLSEMFKGGVLIPGKTIEVVFDPKVQKGLAEGVLEVVPASNGGYYADARQTADGRFAGKGRIVESESAKRVGVAAFQLVSIAVAQYHLAEINESLVGLRKAIEAIRQEAEAKELATLLGDVRYLDECVENALRGRATQLPLEKRVKVEDVYKGVLNQLQYMPGELQRLGQEISAFNTTNMVGLVTDGRLEELERVVKDWEPAVRRFQVLGEVACKVSLVRAWQNPDDAYFAGELAKDMQKVSDAFSGLSLNLSDKLNDAALKPVWVGLDKFFDHMTRITTRREVLQRQMNSTHDFFRKAMEWQKAAIEGVAGGMQCAVTLGGRGEIVEVVLLDHSRSTRTPVATAQTTSAAR